MARAGFANLADVSATDPARHEVSTFADVVAPADDYRAGRPIVVNVVAETDTGRRIIDFMSGLAYGTGGPPIEENLYTEAMLAAAFADLAVDRLAAYDAEIVEGTGHVGMSALIDLVATKPG